MKQTTDTVIRLTDYFDLIAERWDRWQEHNQVPSQKHKTIDSIPYSTACVSA